MAVVCSCCWPVQQYRQGRKAVRQAVCCATGASGDAPAAGGRKRKGPKKPYSPQLGTANYAFLITLYQARTVMVMGKRLVQDACTFRLICSDVTWPSSRGQADQPPQHTQLLLMHAEARFTAVAVLCSTCNCVCQPRDRCRACRASLPLRPCSR